MTGFDLILWRRGLNWTQERAAAELGISRTSLVKYEDGETVPRTIHLATVALT
ncbi:helix-turn-helix transcriptional regulator, partial [Paraburkholderia ginsengiterrae]|nr:helix-turn-helix transcriptional regulator [Paraburkholderia ginsengiterrae]